MSIVTKGDTRLEEPYYVELRSPLSLPPDRLYRPKQPSEGPLVDVPDPASLDQTADRCVDNYLTDLYQMSLFQVTLTKQPILLMTLNMPNKLFMRVFAYHPTA